MSFIPQPSPEAGAFGCVFRSSAIFYFRQNASFRTTLCTFDYWLPKRGIEVALVASLRDCSGRLVRREEIPRTGNYRPLADGEVFEGSVEIEAFAGRDLVIPYAAVMAVYETPRSRCVVHSYSRVYSPHEIEDGRVVREGEEACWTVRDGTFAVLHNGAGVQPAQVARLTVRNAAGESRELRCPIPELSPYATYVLRPELASFLGGRPGQAALSFRVNGAFTRLLVGNEGPNDFQATHSNFNYSVHESASLEGDAQGAAMRVPDFPGFHRQIVVYPDRAAGEYEVSADGRSAGVLRDRQTLEIEASELTFHKRDGRLPCRIVTGLRLWRDESRLPVECSLGVVHRLTHPKRFFWGLCGGGAGSTLVIVAPTVPDAPITVRLLGIERRFTGDTTLEGLFPEAAEALRRDYLWYTVYSEYRRLQVYTLWNDGERLAFEHAF